MENHKRFYTVIKSCRECPFWSGCPLHDFAKDRPIPEDCVLEPHTGTESERVYHYKDKGGM